MSAAFPQPYRRLESDENPYRGEVIVGKDILELLSSSMYIDPLTIYREFVQNSVDAIDQAASTGIIGSHSEGRIDILLDHINRRAVIRDNGIGVSANEFVHRMTSFGASAKRGTTARGFRGVGRLSGLGYCQELVFRSKTARDKRVSVIRWSGRLLKELLSESTYKGTLAELVQQVVAVSTCDPGEWPQRFFEIEVVKPRRIANDILLNETAIAAYLAQVAPCPFAPTFRFAKEIGSVLETSKAVANAYNIFINDCKEPLYRAFGEHIAFSETQISAFRSLRPFTIEAVDGGTAAAGWILHHDYLGAIPVGAGVRGLRARVGNIQIGNDRIFSEIFPEERFCSWTVGEVHILDARVMPNGRRDDFEQSSHLTNILTHLVPYGHEVARHCRSSSRMRNRQRGFELTEQKILEKIEVIQQDAVPKSINSKLKREISAQLSEMKNVAGFDLFSEEVQNNLQARTAKLDAMINSLFSSKKQLGNKSLSKLSTVKQNAYREIFALIYECSANQPAARALINRMLQRLSKVK